MSGVDFGLIKLGGFGVVVCLFCVGLTNPQQITQATEAIAAKVGEITGATPDSSSVLQPAAAALFGEVGNLGVGAWAIGNAEGTLDDNGNPTDIYEGHGDPSNGALNKGFGSWQASPVANAQEGDEKALERIKTQCIPHTFQSFAEHGLPVSTRLLVESCDIWIQAPKAAVDFAKNLKDCQDEGKNGDDAILCARTRNYINPETGQPEVAKIFQDPAALEHDQRRRMGEIADILSRHASKISQPVEGSVMAAEPAPEDPAFQEELKQLKGENP